ncbi:lipocalin family protein [Salinisphaera dokdonensis CL-ES53]|uniref:Outer membrane lipoprotein Blc n=1 Tax=Salinisphaera dokdonensis CL-ES53 TaxID=1304272 RepID=A0ABV2AXT5_9GAMM
MSGFKKLIALCAPGLLAACSVMPADNFPVEEQVDIDRYMGKWYVIAHIPPSVTENAYNSIERYEQIEPGKIATTFTYLEGGFDGEQKTMKPTGSVIENTDNAVWAMRFYWVMRMQYLISYVDADYQTTIVAREKRDYVWIMARTPQIDDATYDSLVQKVADYGYDTSKLRKVPQQPLDQRSDG